MMPRIIESFSEILDIGQTAIAVYTSGKYLEVRGNTAKTAFWPMRRERVDVVIIFLKSELPGHTHQVWIGDFQEKQSTGKHQEGGRDVEKFRLCLSNYRLAGVTDIGFTTFCDSKGSRKQAIYLPKGKNSSRRNWLFEAGKIWEYLIRKAPRPTLVHYEDVAPIIRTNALSVAHALAPIQTYCLEKGLPALTSLVVSKKNELPGPGFFACSLEELKEEWEKVSNHPWSSETNPFTPIRESENEEALINKLLAMGENAVDVYTRVKIRGVLQSLFRRAVLRTYGHACAFCGLTFEDALEAAHIVPWSKGTKHQRVDICNGICLCRTHHRLFDKGWLSVDDNGKIIFSDHGHERGSYSASDMYISHKLHNRKMTHPKDPRHHPKPDYLSTHRKEHKFS